MIRTPITAHMIEAWEELYTRFRPRLKPNRKSGQDLMDYLKEYYSLEMIEDEEARNVILDNVLENDWIKEKIPEGVEPNPVAFYIEFEGDKIFAGIDLASGYYLVEECEYIWDELCAFQGLDEEDLENYYLVAEYVNCLDRFGKLKEVLQSF